MRVNPTDGVCRSCGGELEIVDADDATMTVECQWMESSQCLDSRRVWDKPVSVSVLLEQRRGSSNGQKPC